ncbi:hypothetical protein QYF61_023274 [Mycteria americana]|uniref:Uncharacterized protein n=1 Tax=Mycteria americana TaxID=33587 RepID=A0AAN7NDN7_MYCAM|nr:hypothetical protein QYF61_023274 [Mycteria americana]
MRHLIEGCLAYPNENQQLLALCWGLACAYRATVQYYQRTVVKAGTQTTSENTLTETRVQTTSEDMIVEIGTQTASADTMVEIGTQITTTTVIAPEVNLTPQWTRRSKGPYHRLVREEEEEEGFDQEAGPSAKKLEEGVREFRQEAETTWSVTSSELRDVRKDYSCQPGERIAAWLLRCWDSGANSQQLEGKEAKQLGSLARNGGIERGIGKEAAICSLWRWLLSSVRARYPFKEDLVNYPGKWTTVDEDIRYLRELIVLEVIYSDLDNDKVSKDPEDVLCTQAMWRKGHRTHLDVWSDKGMTRIVCIGGRGELNGGQVAKAPHCDGSRGPLYPWHRLLQERVLQGPKGYQWDFAVATVNTEIRQLSSLPGLSEDPFIVGLLQVEEQQVPTATRMVHQRQYRTNRDSLAPIHELIHQLESQGSHMTLQKSNGGWRLTVDYHGLNEVKPPLSAAVPDILELQYELESKADKWYATADTANVFFSIPLAAEYRPQFAFTWRGVQYTQN